MTYRELERELLRSDDVVPSPKFSERVIGMTVCRVLGHSRFFMFALERPDGEGAWFCLRCGARCLNGCSLLEVRAQIVNAARRLSALEHGED